MILLVCTPKALRPFQTMFRNHAIERSYLAVVEGIVKPSRGTIDLPLVADRGDGRRGAAGGDEDGVPAVTHYEVIEQFGVRASLLNCRLETGRTHQIRIHLAEIGHPVIGDAVYGRKGRSRFPVPFPRQALHAQALGFVHPMSGQALRIEAPLPSDLKDLSQLCASGLARHAKERVANNFPISYSRENNDGWPGQSAACPGRERLRIPGHAALCPGHPDADRSESCYSPITKRVFAIPGGRSSR